MGKPDLRQRPSPAHGDIEPDESGFLHDAAMRRAVLEMGGDGSVEVLEALAALRLAAKQIHDSMERFAEQLRLTPVLCEAGARAHEQLSEMTAVHEILLHILPL